MTYKKTLSSFLAVILILICMPLNVSADVRGDANGDGFLTVRDAAFIASYLSKRQALPESADFNNDGIVNIRDASAIANQLVSPYSEYAKIILELVNQERAKVGVSPLTLDQQLSNAANVRAEEITEYFSHSRPDGSSFSSVLDELSINYYCCGENIAVGCPTAEFTVQQWIKSPGHYGNIIDPNYTKLGVGYYYNANSAYGHHWVQLFKCD